MPNKIRIAISFAAVAVLAATCFAQAENARPPEAPKAFRLDFVLKEFEDGKVVNSRSYSMTVSAVNNAGSIRAGDKIPVVTRAGDAHETTYLDVGVNIDCRSVVPYDDKLSLIVTADITKAGTDSNPPLIRSNKWSSGVVVSFRKSTVLFSSDDASAKRRLQLELTAAPQ